MNSIERRIWIRVLNMYRDLPHLWDRKNLGYANKHMREKSMRVLLEVYNEIDEEATVDILKTKITNMRTCFFRELKKVRSSETGDGPEGVYVPSLWYYNHLMFLLEEAGELSTSEVQNSTDPLDMEEQLYEKRESLEKRGPQEKNPMPKRKPKQTIIKTHDEKRNLAKAIVTKKEDKWEIIAKAIAIQLQNIDDGQLTIANKIISDAIFYAKTGKLTNNSSINLGFDSEHKTEIHD